MAKDDFRMELGQNREIVFVSENSYPNICEFCQKTFVTKLALTLHVRTHTGEKPYKCKNCDQAFAQQDQLWRHTRKSFFKKRFFWNFLKCSGNLQHFLEFYKTKF